MACACRRWWQMRIHKIDTLALESCMSTRRSTRAGPHAPICMAQTGAQGLHTPFKLDEFFPSGPPLAGKNLYGDVFFGAAR